MLVSVFGACGYLDQKLGPIAPRDLVSAGQDLYKAVDLNDQEVAKLSREIVLEADQNNRIADSSSIYTRRLAKMIIPHLAEDGLKLNYKVYLDEEVNAFSLADGSIRIYSGLMDLLADRELLAVIGHEIGHVKLGHSKSQLQRSYAASAALKSTSSSLQSGMGNSTAGVAGAIGASAIAELASQVIQAQFSQDDETAADEYSVQFLRRHHYDPRSLVVALSKFRNLEEEGDEGMVGQLLSSHPGSGERIEHIELVLASPAAPAPVLVAEKSDSGIGERPAKEDVASHTGRKAPQSKNSEKTRVALKMPTHLAKTEVVTPAPAPKLVEIDTESSEEGTASAAGWYIQVGAFPEQSQANDMKSALEERSVNARIQAAKVKGAVYQRVLVGPFPNKKVADAQVRNVAAHGIFEGEPFIRHLPN